jgi:hypothetical protein
VKRGDVKMLMVEGSTLRLRMGAGGKMTLDPFGWEVEVDPTLPEDTISVWDRKQDCEVLRIVPSKDVA